MIVIALVWMAIALIVVAAWDRSPSDRWLAIFLALLLLLVAWILHDDGSSKSSSGNRVTRVEAAAPAIVAEVTTSTSSPAGRIAPTPPASVSPRGETTSSTPAGDVADLGVFTVTCYGPPHFPAGQTTASGQPVGPGSIAVDPAVIRMGTKLDVEGYGVGVANDRGSAVRGRHVDIWRADPYHDCPIRSARVRIVS